MFKILIVDDEKLYRDILKNQIEWDKLNVSTVETAKDGFIALDIIKDIKPDILVTDVKMPGMTGLSLAEKARELVPWIKIIFVSGFDDFEYIKSALSVNAYEYILKPIDIDELVGALKIVINERSKEKKAEEDNKLLLNTVNESRNLLKHRFLCDVVYGTAEKENLWWNIANLDVNIQEGFYNVLLCEIDDFNILEEELSSPQLKNMEDRILGIMRDIKNDACYMEHFQTTQSRYVVILSFNSFIEKERINTAAAGIAEHIIKTVGSQCKISLSVGVGCLVESIDDLHKSYTISSRALIQKMYAGKGNILFYQPKSSLKENRIDVQSLGNEICACITTYDTNKAMFLVDYLFDNIEEATVYDGKYIRNCCISLISRIEFALMEINERFENIFGEQVVLWDKLMKFETIMDIRQWMKNIIKAVIEYLDGKSDRKNRKIVSIIVKHIEENYSKEITLKDIANQFYYSPNYLGLIFKEEMGQGFSEYVAEYRMKKASELLKQQYLRMYEVAEQVGYKNVSAFINQFKENYKMTPKEYRERFLSDAK